jgi:hypothetical protein
MLFGGPEAGRRRSAPDIRGRPSGHLLVSATGRVVRAQPDRSGFSVTNVRVLPKSASPSARSARSGDTQLTLAVRTIVVQFAVSPIAPTSPRPFLLFHPPPQVKHALTSITASHVASVNSGTPITITRRSRLFMPRYVLFNT